MPEESINSDLNAGKSAASDGAQSNGHGRQRGEDPQVDRDMDELRRLLIGNEGKQIEGLQARLNDVSRFKEEGQVDAMGRELPQAIAYHNKDNSKLANALGPTIEETISLSIRRNPQPFADAIFPVIGPAIRRSIAEALRSVIESMNRAMEHSFSVQSMKWRIEAAKSGRSFSEVMLSHTLNYRVEQLFLIDKKSGLLIQHLFAETVEVMDSDVVSSMLNAIQDFVRDSLGAPREDVLDTIKIGDLTVLVEPGPDAILAAVVRGIPTTELSITLKEIIEAIHLQYGHILDDFDGDTDPLTPVLPLMRAGLLENYKQKERKPYRLWIIAGIIALGLTIWFVWSFRNYMLWTEYLEDLRNEPGLVVTQTSWEQGRFVVEGLKDPMATHPDSLVPEALPLDRVDGMWESYLALDSLIIIKRATKQLRAPAGVAFQLENDTLFARGKAPADWIVTAREKASFLLGFATYDDRGVAEDVSAEINDAIAEIRNTFISFAQGASVFAQNQRPELNRLVDRIQLLEALGAMADRNVLIYGSASSEGDLNANQRLSQARARSVREALVTAGLSLELITAIDTGDPRVSSFESSEAERAANRRVTFDIVER
ncbi:MAG: OmpA family protein [Rhodothermales bacterium]